MSLPTSVRRAGEKAAGRRQCTEWTVLEEKAKLSSDKLVTAYLNNKAQFKSISIAKCQIVFGIFQQNILW